MIVKDEFLSEILKLDSSLQKEDESSKKVWELAENNPKWITISSIGSMLTALVMLIGKIALK